MNVNSSISKEMHPFIHPTDKHNNKNRPEHNHSYRPVLQIHHHATRLAANNHQFIPNPHQYKQNAEPTHTAEYLSQRYTEIWNALPPELRNTAAPNSFATALKKHLLLQQRMS